MSADDYHQTTHTKTKNLKRPSNTVAENACLVRIHPLDLENKMARLTENTVTLGREKASDIFCNDTSISRHHARIDKTEVGFFIEDCQSTNGTYVDGQTVTRKQLCDGAKIQVGNHIFKFLAGDSIESQYHETMYAMMTQDGLTNVFNKRYLVDAVSREFERSQAYGRDLSVVLMDIDFFKGFNDNYGHLAGDEVLQEFASRIDQECGPNRIFARFGGEEFAILMVETALEEATEFAETLRNKIASQMFLCCNYELKVTASFGVAQYDPNLHTIFSDLLENADQRLYRAKSDGRNQVCSTI